MALVNGRDIVWINYKPPAKPDSLLLSMSIAKTITSAAVGKAICDGKLTFDTTAEEIVPELKGTDLGLATVRNLLMMTSGTWEGNPDTTIWTPEQRQQLVSGAISILDLLKSKKVSDAHSSLFSGKRKAGEAFAYRATDTLLLGVMINRATGQTFAEWVEQKILLPAGIESVAVIMQDHFKYALNAGSIRMTARDWIRFAVWMKESQQEKGCFGDYLKQATKKQISNNMATQNWSGYGYFIWTENVQLRDSYWARGYGGQRIAWNQSNSRMLVVFSNVQNIDSDLSMLYRKWATLPQ